jgi:hypothetical protein
VPAQVRTSPTKSTRCWIVSGGTLIQALHLTAAAVSVFRVIVSPAAAADELVRSGAEYGDPD